MTISKEEIALYDRQIRLWGMDAQKKIREGNVFIVAECMSGTLQELCKNLTLSGLGSIQVTCLNQDSVIGPLLYSNLEASLREINNKLNFSYSVSKSDPVEDFNESVSSVDFLVLIGHLNRSLLISFNEAARARNICTSWNMSRGNYCYVLNDFMSFDLPGTSAHCQFPSFAEVFSRDAAKSHRNALIKSFSTIEEGQEEEEASQTAYRLAGAAMVGALLSQEIIKFYSRKDAPINNLVALDTSCLKNYTAQI